MIDKLNLRLESIKKLELRRSQGDLLLQEEIQASIHDVEAILNEFPKDSQEYRIFNKDRRNSMYWSKNKSGYAEDDDFKKLTRKKNVLVEILSRHAGIVTDQDDQYYFSEGAVFDAKYRVWQILKSAQKEIVIIDQYLDDAVFEYIQKLDKNISIKLLGSTKKDVFPGLVTAYNKQFGNLEAKANKKCHDRYIIIDDQACWHIGASLNGLGIGAHSINKIQEGSKIETIRDDFNRWWLEGAEI